MDGNWFYLLIPMAAALAASLALTPVVRRLAWRLRVLAHPDAQRRFHPGPVPLLGGVAVYFALVAGLVAALLLDRFRQADLARLCWALIPAAALACLFGAVDDCCNLRSRAKLVLQFLAALPITAAGFSVDFIIVFGCRIELGWWGMPLTIFWLMGCINALNLIDGLDGLASVVGLSTTSMMGIIAMNMGNDHVAAAAMALTAALAGFLVFNRPPASIFLGDSGSTLIGLVIGVLGIQGSLEKFGHVVDHGARGPHDLAHVRRAHGGGSPQTDGKAPGPGRPRAYPPLSARSGGWDRGKCWGSWVPYALRPGRPPPRPRFFAWTPWPGSSPRH